MRFRYNSKGITFSHIIWILIMQLSSRIKEKAEKLKQKPQITICTSKDLFGLGFGAEAAPKVVIDSTVKSKTKKYNKNQVCITSRGGKKPIIRIRIGICKTENESERHFKKLLVPKSRR